ncbi:hypothetical protein SCHPADRAFT_904171 [Schizopora paradoxa]|uniref:Uncharacterized protein n=1 Tax=Schizopora paradoxa TaxID=27342 RepID=A0A0H2RND0_9AGAM|nr:hypothetical protein SCHPADRAFT_904171 [Schizopora paradoxa]
MSSPLTPLAPGDSESSETPSLVGAVKKYFAPNANLKGNDEYKSLIVKSTGADPLLSKSLVQSVAVVERHINTARSTFSTVDSIIKDKALDICLHIEDLDRKSILKDWEEISKAFENILVSSRDVAFNGALLIGDFLSSIIPYLLEDGEIEDKQRELEGYRKSLEEGGERADLFANNFHEISSRVINFKKKWSAHTKETTIRLLSEIDKLQRDLVAVAKNVDEAKMEFSSILARKRLKTDRKSRQMSKKKLVKGLVKDVKQTCDVQKKSDPQVSKRAVEIQERTGDLVVVWNLIHDDLGIIEGQIAICRNGHSLAVFKQRVGKLAVQYEDLMGALQSYAMALSLAGKGPAQPLPVNNSLWRKILFLGN